MNGKELELLIRDKYNGDASLVTEEDRSRLVSGEPLAYVIGWVPFLGLRIDLGSRPLIPRPETEWWTEQLIDHLRERFGDTPFSLLDLCAGSGAIGLSMLKTFPNSRVYFGELIPEHCELIRKNIEINNLDASRADIRESHLFESFRDDAGEPLLYNVIATNPPYIPEDRELDQSVLSFEPQEALFAGSDGLRLIRSIAEKAEQYLLPDGELWMECDVSNIEEAKDVLLSNQANKVELLTDQYGRSRVAVAYY